MGCSAGDDDDHDIFLRLNMLSNLSNIFRNIINISIINHFIDNVKWKDIYFAEHSVQKKSFITQVNIFSIVCYIKFKYIFKFKFNKLVSLFPFVRNKSDINKQSDKWLCVPSINKVIMIANPSFIQSNSFCQNLWQCSEK